MTGLFDCIGAPLSRNESSQRPTLIRCGDILEFALAEQNVAAMAFELFASGAFSRDGRDRRRRDIGQNPQLRVRPNPDSLIKVRLYALVQHDAEQDERVICGFYRVSADPHMHLHASPHRGFAHRACDPRAIVQSDLRSETDQRRHSLRLA